LEPILRVLDISSSISIDKHPNIRQYPALVEPLTKLNKISESLITIGLLQKDQILEYTDVVLQLSRSKNNSKEDKSTQRKKVIIGYPKMLFDELEKSIKSEFRHGTSNTSVK
jgi:hypothetical protein